MQDSLRIPLTARPLYTFSKIVQQTPETLNSSFTKPAIINFSPVMRTPDMEEPIVESTRLTRSVYRENLDDYKINSLQVENSRLKQLIQAEKDYTEEYDLLISVKNYSTIRLTQKLQELHIELLNLKLELLEKQ